MADQDYKPLTPGERAVWAAEFVRACSVLVRPSQAAAEAHNAVLTMRGLTDGMLKYDVRAMLDDMLAPDTGLFCADGARGTFAPGTAPCSRCLRPAVEHRAR